MSRVACVLAFLLLAGCSQPDDGREQVLAELAEIEAQLEKGQDLERKLPALETEMENLDAQVNQLEQVLVRGEADGLPRLRHALESSGFRAPSLRSLGVVEIDGMRELQVAVEASTPARQTFLVIEELSRRPLLVVIDELSIRNDDPSGMAQVSFTARLGLAPDSP